MLIDYYVWYVIIDNNTAHIFRKIVFPPIPPRKGSYFITKKQCFITQGFLWSQIEKVIHSFHNFSTES